MASAIWLSKLTYLLLDTWISFVISSINLIKPKCDSDIMWKAPSDHPEPLRDSSTFLPCPLSSSFLPFPSFFFGGGADGGYMQNPWRTCADFSGLAPYLEGRFKRSRTVVLNLWITTRLGHISDILHIRYLHYNS